jgi:alkaline phosphatase D
MTARSLCAAVFALLICGFFPSGAAALRADEVLTSAPLPVDEDITRIAFGSCFKEQRDDDRAWHALVDWAPQLFVYAGDTLYPDRDDDSAALPRLRAAYDALGANAAFTRLRSTTPVLPVWDDHDYGRNDGGADYAFREQSEDLFLQRWGVAEADPRAQRPGIYRSWIVGKPGRRIQVLLLDTRYFRSPLKVTDERGARGRERYVPDDDPGKTLLGEAQWRWLERELAREAEDRLLVSSIQVLADGHGWEGWRQLPRERARLFSLLRAADAAPVLLLSGDRHVAGFYEQDIGRSEPLLEFTSSALNNTIPMQYRRNTLAEAGPNRLGDLYGEANFGGLVFDWQGGRLRLELRDADGTLVRRLERPLPLAAP